MYDSHTKTDVHLNGFDIARVEDLAERIADDKQAARTTFRVKTRWLGGCASETTTGNITVGGEISKRSFKVRADAPGEMAGTNAAANPQELLMAALNACMVFGYVAQATQRGLAIRRLEIALEGTLDLRGALGVEGFLPGCKSLKLVASIDADGTEEEWQEIHALACANSPNFFNVTRPIPVEASLTKRRSGKA